MTNLDSVFESKNISLLTKVHTVKAIVLPVVMCGCENWTIKKAEHWRIDAFKLWCWRRLESPLNSKEIKPVNPEGNQSWIFIGRIDAKTPILWPPDVKSQLTGKDPDAGKDWGQEEKGETENNMDGWHHWRNSHHFEQTQGDSEGQGSLECCNSWCHTESVTTWWLNNKILNMLLIYMGVRTKFWYAPERYPLSNTQLNDPSSSTLISS